MCWRRKARVWAPASSRLMVDERMASSRPLRVCMATTTSGICSSSWSVACTTRSGPSAISSRLSSVRRVAISTMTCRLGFEPRHLQVHPGEHGGDANGSSGRAAGPRLAGCSRWPWLDSTPTCRCRPTPGPATPGSTWWPARTPVIARAGGRVLMPTGVAVAIPDGHAGFVLPRSGIALRHGVTCLNTPGLIDSGYRGELKVLLINTDPTEDHPIQPGRPHRPAGGAAGRARDLRGGRRAGRRQRAGPGRLRPHRPLNRIQTLGSRQPGASGGQQVAIGASRPAARGGPPVSR